MNGPRKPLIGSGGYGLRIFKKEKRKVRKKEGGRLNLSNDPVVVVFWLGCKIGRNFRAEKNTGGPEKPGNYRFLDTNGGK